MNILRWLRAHEPLWMVSGAAAILDALTQFVPAVPDSWHPGVDIAIAVLTVAAGRQLVVSPATAAKEAAPPTT